MGNDSSPGTAGALASQETGPLAKLRCPHEDGIAFRPTQYPSAEELGPHWWALINLLKIKLPNANLPSSLSW